MFDDDLPAHRCHANGCETPELRYDMPFCKTHFKMLPRNHQKKLWNDRPVGGCGVCTPRLKEKDMEWLKLVNLDIVLLCRIEYGEHGCPDKFIDDGGFCWACGCDGVPRVYEVAEEIIRRAGPPVNVN